MSEAAPHFRARLAAAAFSAGTAFGLIVIHLAHPTWGVDTTTLGLLALLIVALVLPFVKSFTLPGGGGGVFSESDTASLVRKAEAALPTSTRAGITGFLTAPGGVGRPQAGGRDQNEDRLPDGDAWLNYMRVDPTIGLAGLRIELERVLRSIYVAKGIHDPRVDRVAAGMLLEDLAGRGLIPRALVSAAREVIATTNRAVHAQTVAPDAAQTVAQIGLTVLGALRELASEPSPTHPTQ